MAIECLVRKYDGTDGRKSGDIITVKDTPCSWGAAEGPPNYIIVSVNGITKEEFAPYNVRNCGTGVFVDGEEVTVRSKYRYLFSILPNYTEQAVVVTVNTKQCIESLRNRVEEYIASR